MLKYVMHIAQWHHYQLDYIFFANKKKKKKVHSRPPTVHPKLWVYKLLLSYWFPDPWHKVPTNQRGELGFMLVKGCGQSALLCLLSQQQLCYMIDTIIWVQRNVRFMTTLCMLRKWPCTCACMYSRLHLPYYLDPRGGTFLEMVQGPSLSELCVCAVIVWWPICIPASPPVTPTPLVTLIRDKPWLTDRWTHRRPLRCCLLLLRQIIRGCLPVSQTLAPASGP